MKPVQKSYVPSHRDFVVQFASGDYQSSLVSLKEFAAGEVMASLTGLTKGPKAYTSVQCGPGAEDHLELHSDFVYANHSCGPNIVFDMSSHDPSEWHLRALKRIVPGDAVTFFYPSTEWDMDQPFNCTCGTAMCLKTIQGAKYLSKAELLARSWVSPWILELVKERDGEAS
ncbi:hypothetical protein B0H34DRAFT_418720 [Crassisporium funariophilum]|nr:hypothetical protein B0H34DRAFT_418720 [Crassisporium funariophilum]